MKPASFSESANGVRKLHMRASVFVPAFGAVCDSLRKDAFTENANILVLVPVDRLAH